MRKDTIAPIQTLFDEIQPNNYNNNNDIISQSTINAQKENLFTNTLEKNLSIMNFNPTVSRSIELNDEIIDNKYLNVNLVSNYLHILYNINFLKYIITFSQLQN